MNGRAKLHNALNHIEGPIPMDFGSAPVSGIHASVVEQLRDYYGLEKRPVRIMEPMQMLGCMDRDLKEAMGIDTIDVWNRNTLFGFTDEGAKEWLAPWGQSLIVPQDFHTTKDAQGNIFIYPQGDTHSAPSGKMTYDGYFFNEIVRGHNFDEDDPCIEDNLEEFTEISEEDLADIKEKAQQAFESGLGVLGNFGGTAIGDISCVPGIGLKAPKGLRDVEAWYIATVLHQDYLHQIFEYQTDMALKNLEKIYATIKDAVQVVYICGTDFGTQNAPFCSVETFRTLYMPYYKKINEWVHQHTNWKTFKHTCGSIRPLIPHMIESGFDILNPVQWSAQDMDIKMLKREFGQDVVFWGGGVNTQTTLAYGSPEDVRSEALRCCELFSPDGGFVFNAIHNVQAKTPVANVIALSDAVKEFNA